MDILPLIQIQDGQRQLAGDKAVSLSKLLQEKFPVAEGYVVTNDVLSSFLKQNNIDVTLRSELSNIKLDDLHSVDYASRKLRDLVFQSEIPLEQGTEILQQFTHIKSQFMAVRSSAYTETVGTLLAGDLPSYLHVPVTDLHESIKKCWAGLFSTRSLYYLIQQEVDPSTMAMGVILQKMIPAKTSGRVYTYHPVTQDPHQMVIEATRGFGEMGGETPMFDTYIVQREPYKILSKTIQYKPVQYVTSPEGGLTVEEIPEEEQKESTLSNEHVKELMDFAAAVEKHHEYPVEVEWSYKDQFWLNQVREHPEAG